ncbi:MAG: hypothetical protein ALECFALPRED_000917 [Alectoria fallacina]|uniref:Uncharacterized protein n=1 Tax=Alectoria fallacina TaxID=1903189 RepID=A0A8H3PKU9_9LECA|nr:MAG: hypothetical protein ALECFALPRED_000917 [Alectoria fallacina]
MASVAQCATPADRLGVNATTRHPPLRSKTSRRERAASHEPRKSNDYTEVPPEIYLFWFGAALTVALICSPYEQKTSEDM